jgi:hypothetical protein
VQKPATSRERLDFCCKRLTRQGEDARQGREDEKALLEQHIQFILMLWLGGAQVLATNVRRPHTERYPDGQSLAGAQGGEPEVPHARDVQVRLCRHNTAHHHLPLPQVPQYRTPFPSAWQSSASLCCRSGLQTRYLATILLPTLLWTHCGNLISISQTDYGSWGESWKSRGTCMGDSRQRHQHP